MNKKCKICGVTSSLIAFKTGYICTGCLEVLKEHNLLESYR